MLYAEAGIALPFSNPLVSVGSAGIGVTIDAADLLGLTDDAAEDFVTVWVTSYFSLVNVAPSLNFLKSGQLGVDAGPVSFSAGIRLEEVTSIDEDPYFEDVTASWFSGQTVDAAGLRDLLHLYRARNAAIHEGDCFYKDDQQGTDIYCDLSHASRFLTAAQAFAYWLDSQA